MKTIIAVPDFTRDAHLKIILPTLFKKLERQGLSGGNVEIIIATGLHRSPTKNEIKQNLGELKVKISVHDYRENKVAYFGRTKKGIPVYLNKKLKDADSVITVGVVEPHLYAGYSGGAKVAAIGLAGEKTINSTHHPRFLDHPGTSICSIEKNPFRDFINEVSGLLPIRYSVNIVNDKKGRISKVFYGKPRESFDKAVRYSKKLSEKTIKRSFDAVICDIPKEKAVNIYQASRAFNYIANTKRNILKRDSIILVKADLSEGFGKGLGEKRFMQKMLGMKDPEKLIADIKKKGCLAGEHRAYMVAKAMLKARLGFISKRADLYKNKTLPFLFFKNPREAVRFLERRFKNPKIYHQNNAFSDILIRK